jgi:2-polyprenyl-3-methyl-5-hydroxy-6-metoxy-1,4-benzoquinol methylase
MSKPCILCGSTEGFPLYQGILRCKKCSLVFADLNLDQVGLFDLYKKNYFFGEEYSDYLADREVLQKNFRLRLNVLARFTNPVRHKSLFEVGCAYGFFLSLARERFEKVQGIDITEEGVKHCRLARLEVIQADLMEVDLKGRDLDVVCFWDTIEHLLEPHRYIEKLSRHMKPGSLLAITTGDIDSWNARLKKHRWRLIHPPTHLYYFSQSTLARLLGQYGFKTIYHQHCGFYRSLDNVFHNIFSLRANLPEVHRFIKRSGLSRLHFYINVYDILYVIAQKR